VIEPMNIGYACLAIAVPGSEMKSCTLKNASPERLLSLIENNLNALDKLITYNIDRGIQLFRISSDLIPFGSSLAADLAWQEIYSDKLAAIGQRILSSGIRVSMHPGQYTVLNSPDQSVAQRAIADLHYHTTVLDSLGLGRDHKIILHLGGVYGHKEEAKNRFIARYKDLHSSIKKRLVIENDDRLYTIADILAVSADSGIPAVYDNLHHAINPSPRSYGDRDWIKACSASWSGDDGRQKIHYSQQHPSKRPGAHSDTIYIDPFLEFWNQIADMDVDIMLEVKDKNLSALKCIHCTRDSAITTLENEWAHYKYAVLEGSPEQYQAIRHLLRNKNAYPAVEMYRKIEAAFNLPVLPGNAVNAAQHVWGYFKNCASKNEHQRFAQMLENFSAGQTKLPAVKKYLLRLALKYQENYLLHGYYFYL
jgi:UV DNA damage endonuclease